ncbi:Hypothetical predicted protein [Pelobates cultripes]|uniref:Uncharacterized protein n=1 Tax=Pelobates cultripes TaxID=61616 RepID=A0AAD1RJH9_PELCU|nr:Hypothetical predicted protein [Pelobates cultripes]
MGPAEMMNVLSTLTQQVTLLSQTVSELQRDFAELKGNTHHAPEPDIALPDQFTGKKTELQSFITACELLFTLKPRTYPNDYVKVCTTITLLSGKPPTPTPALKQSNTGLVGLLCCSNAHVGALCHNPASRPWPLYCSTLHAPGPKRPPNQTNGTIMVPADPAPVPEPQKEATFQSSASVSPKVSCSNTEDLSPDCVIASNGTVVCRQDLKVFEQALKARSASISRLLASTAFSKNNNLQNVPLRF